MALFYISADLCSVWLSRESAGFLTGFCGWLWYHKSRSPFYTLVCCWEWKGQNKVLVIIMRMILTLQDNWEVSGTLPPESRGLRNTFREALFKLTSRQKRVLNLALGGSSWADRKMRESRGATTHSLPGTILWPASLSLGELLGVSWQWWLGLLPFAVPIPPCACNEGTSWLSLETQACTVVLRR